MKLSSAIFAEVIGSCGDEPLWGWAGLGSGKAASAAERDGGDGEFGIFLNLSDDLGGPHGVTEEHDFGAVDGEPRFESIEEVWNIECETEDALPWCNDKPAAVGGFADGASSAVGFKKHVFAPASAVKQKQNGE